MNNCIKETWYKLSSFLRRTFYVWLTIIIYTLLILSITGCTTLKKTSSNETKQTETTVKESSQLENTDTNREIRDTLIVNIPEAKNETEKALIDGILQQLNTSKSSGSNAYRSRYDEETNRLLVEFFIAQTQTKEKEQVIDVQTEKTFEQSVEEYKKKIVTSWWTWLIIAFLLRKEIFWVLSTIYPPLKTLRIFQPSTLPPKT